MTPEIKAKRAKARELMVAKRDAALGGGQTAIANMYFGRLLRLEKGRYDNDLDDLIAGLKMGGPNA